MGSLFIEQREDFGRSVRLTEKGFMILWGIHSTALCSALILRLIGCSDEAGTRECGAL